MNKRPVIKLSLSPADKIAEIAGLVMLIFLWIFTAFAIYNLPDTIPVHFNLSGRPDLYGDRLTLIILPLIGTFVFTLLTVLNKYPHIFNYFPTITEDNAEKHYRVATRMLRVLKLVIVILFTGIVVGTYLTSKGIIAGLPAPGIIVAILMMLAIPVILVLYQTKKSGRL